MCERVMEALRRSMGNLPFVQRNQKVKETKVNKVLKTVVLSDGTYG